MNPFAEVDELRARWPGLPAASESTASQLLEDASVWLRAWFPGVADQAAASPELAAARSMVACSMVKRAMINGDREGQASNSETVGPFGQQVSFRNPDGNLYITKAERGLLDSLTGAVAAAGAVSMYAPGGL